MSLQDVTDAPIPRLPPRDPASHKGTYGKVLAVGGSLGMSGSISITGAAALRSGAGLVTVATPQPVLTAVASFCPCYMTLPLIADDEGCADLANVVDLAQAMDRFEVWAVGPGMGRSAGAAELAIQLYLQTPSPVVVDADGLYALATGRSRNPRLLQLPAGPRILTPHDGEFARLIDADVAESATERAEQAAALCRHDPEGRTIVVLKGHRTIVANDEQFSVNMTGNPGMATAGAGDCLTGVIAALVAQGMSPWDAARLGVHVHGLAGDLAAARIGQISMIATDIIDDLPPAFQQLEQNNATQD